METVIDGYHIQYKITGDGDKNVVILQGWGTTMPVYDSIAEILAPKYRVIQLDLPGFGGSDEPREPWSVHDYVEFFSKFAVRLQLKEMDLIGHSYGGRMIIEICTREDMPFTVRRIVMIDAAGIRPVKTRKQKMKIGWYKCAKHIVELPPVKFLFKDAVSEWKSHQGSEDYRNATPVMRATLVKAVNADQSELLPQIHQDTLLIWGEKDTATPLSDGQMMEKRIPHAGLVVLKGAGHYSFLDQPGIFRRVMESYFEI